LLGQVRFARAICHACWPHALFAPVVKRAGVPLLLWAHEALNGRHWLERWARRTPPDCLIANSHFTAASLPPLFPHTPVEVQYSPVAPPEQADRQRLRTELGVPPDVSVLLQVSRLERLKGQAVLLEALARLREVPGWVCWLVGGPQRPHEVQYQEELEAAVRTAGLTDRVYFLGQRADVRQLLAAADVYCQPNTGPDSFGITFVEALYAGLPVVTSRLGGAAEIVDESCGFLLPPGDANALAAALQVLIQEPGLRDRLGQGGPERARRLCDPERACRALHEILVRRNRVS
jgi:glycosyltransferase involved in cell wall biosynthesis